MRNRISWRTLCAALAVAALAGCANQQRPNLYQWDEFPKEQYQALSRDGTAPEAQIQAMEAQAEKARAHNTALPPGFRAHLGLLHYATGNLGAARQMWEAEKTAFPESAPYMDSLLKRMDKPSTTTPAKKDNPA